MVKKIYLKKKKIKKKLYGSGKNDFKLVSDLDKQFVHLASNKKWSGMIDFFNINKKTLILTLL